MKWVLENEEPCCGHAFNVPIVRAWLRIIDEVKILSPLVASRRFSRSKSRKLGSDKGGVANLVGKAICPGEEDQSVGLPIVLGLKSCRRNSMCPIRCGTNLIPIAIRVASKQLRMDLRERWTIEEYKEDGQSSCVGELETVLVA